MLIDAHLHLDKYSDLLDEALKQIETERIFTVATTTGWAHRADAFGGPDGCESDGQHIPFATTKAQREAVGDPRQSLEERYKNHEGYVKEVAKAAEKLEKQRFLLPADVKRYIEEAQASNVLKATGQISTRSP